MRVMAIDYGDAHTGVAISDIMTQIAGKTFIIHQKDSARLIDELIKTAEFNSVGHIVVGLPVNMDGSHGERAEKSVELAESLRKATDITVKLWDERRTTLDAHRILIENGKRGRKKREMIDAVSAALILEAYLPVYNAKQ